MKRDFTMLAFKRDPKQHVGGWWMSEKLDGMRCVWDGGVTRGLPKSSVPWANTAKDKRYLKEQIATGLWSRYGNVIHAPDWWLDKLPAIPLDGELYTRDLNRQQIFSAIKDIVPGSEWASVQYWVFDLVPLQLWLSDGLIKNTQFTKTLKGCYLWVSEKDFTYEYMPTAGTPFITTRALMEQKLHENNVLYLMRQIQLDGASDTAEQQVQEFAANIVAQGGEGAMIKSPMCFWRPERVHEMMKIKPTEDAEGTVVGYVTGRETDKGSKLLGMMGALVIRLENGNVMELSGFTDGERELGTLGAATDSARAWAAAHPEEQCPDWIEAVQFPRGTVVTFKYRGLSDKGIPQEARYWRKHASE